MVALIFLAIGLLCGFIGRVLLLGPAFGVSVWWGLGVLLPFGPLLFRLSYPDLAPLSRKFRLAMLPCIFVYFALRPGPLSSSHYDQFFKRKSVPSVPANGYGLEKIGGKVREPSLVERRVANAREMDRLNAWSEALRLKKRDLLHSDFEGNRVYDLELAQYNAALAKATAEQKALEAAK